MAAYQNEENTVNIQTAKQIERCVDFSPDYAGWLSEIFIYLQILTAL